MNPLILPFVNGQVFFYGMVGTVLVCGLAGAMRGAKYKSVLNIVGILGAVGVVLSGTPVPVWMYILWLLLLCGALALLMRKVVPRPKHRYTVTGAFVMLSVAMVGLEAPYHVTPKIPLPTAGTLYVIGDSLSMGADTQDRNWPELLGKKAGLEVKNLSVGGATVGSALYNVKRIEDNVAAVILEIGGNDLLSETSPKEFEANLEEMLKGVCLPGRYVALIELPLPPFYNAYGSTQRRAAKAHGAHLIPKKCLASVLVSPGATVDGLHLSHLGHALLAEELWRVMSSGREASVEESVPAA